MTATLVGGFEGPAGDGPSQLEPTPADDKPGPGSCWTPDDDVPIFRRLVIEAWPLDSWPLVARV